MNHNIAMSDEAYRQLKRIADENESTPAAVMKELIMSMALGPDGQERHYCSLDNWFRHLGVSDEEIAEADAEVEAEDTANADTR